MYSLKENTYGNILGQVFTNTDSAKDKEIQRELEEGKKRCRDTIQETAKKYGYQHGLGEDVYPNRNYGLDQNGEVRIHDVHLLSWNLPDRFKLPEEERHGQFYNSPRRKSLEKAIAQAGVIISLSSGLVLLSPNLTGNTIANLNQTSSNWMANLFILGLTSALLYFNKNDRILYFLFLRILSILLSILVISSLI